MKKNRDTLKYYSRLAFLLSGVLNLINIKAVAQNKAAHTDRLKIIKGGYFYMPGLNVLVYNNTFPEGHQGGVEIIQHGVHV